MSSAATGTDRYTVENLGSTPVRIEVDGVEGTVPAGTTAPIANWTFQGFTGPVDGPPVLNVVKAGRAVPLRWSIVDADGDPVTDLATARLTVTGLSCALGSTPDAVEETVTGASGLLDLGGGRYQVNWASPAAYAGSCKTLNLDIGDGVRHPVYFRVTR